MNHTEKLITALCKSAATDFWNTGFTTPRGAASADTNAFAHPASKTIPKPKAEEPAGGQNASVGHKPVGSGAFNKAVWMDKHPGMVAGKGHGPEFTTGMSGEAFRA